MEAVLSLRNNRALGAELVIPTNAIALDCDETEYVDGGATYSTHWWGIHVILTEQDTKKLIFGGIVATGAASFLPPPANAVLVALFSISAGYLDLVDNGKGVNLNLYLLGGIATDILSASAN